MLLKLTIMETKNSSFEPIVYRVGAHSPHLSEYRRIFHPAMDAFAGMTGNGGFNELLNLLNHSNIVSRMREYLSQEGITPRRVHTVIDGTRVSHIEPRENEREVIVVITDPPDIDELS